MNAIKICMEVRRGGRMPKQGSESAWISSSARPRARRERRSGREIVQEHALRLVGVKLAKRKPPASQMRHATAHPKCA